jgi:hypothetical protein
MPISFSKSILRYFSFKTWYETPKKVMFLNDLKISSIVRFATVQKSETLVFFLEMFLSQKLKTSDKQKL